MPPTLNPGTLRFVRHCTRFPGPLWYLALAAGPGQSAAVAGAKPGSGKKPYLDAYTENLTGKARKGKVGPVLGSDSEIRQMIDVVRHEGCSD